MTGLALTYLDASYGWLLLTGRGLGYATAIVTTVGAIVGAAP